MTSRRRSSRVAGRLLSRLRRRRAGGAGDGLDLAALTALFAKLGCRDPEMWARSQVEEGINQLGRFLFLRHAWAEAVPQGSTEWIDNILQNCPAGTASGAAWRRLLGSGADRADLARIVRDTQAEMIFAMCRLLDGPDEVDPPVSDFQWRLFEVDAEGQCTAPIGFLHESVWELDPERAPHAGLSDR